MKGFPIEFINSSIKKTIFFRIKINRMIKPLLVLSITIAVQLSLCVSMSGLSSIHMYCEIGNITARIQKLVYNRRTQSQELRRSELYELFTYYDIKAYIQQKTVKSREFQWSDKLYALFLIYDMRTGSKVEFHWSQTLYELFSYDMTTYIRQCGGRNSYNSLIRSLMEDSDILCDI